MSDLLFSPMADEKGSVAGVLASRNVMTPLFLAGLLFFFSFYDFLLFHTLAELFAITIGMLMFAVAWHTYPYSRNDYLMFLACGYFWIALLDLAHALVYKGMSVLPVADANPSTQLWVAARYMEGVLLLLAPLFIKRQGLRRGLVFLGIGVIASALFALVMTGHFPDAYVEGQGLTAFKINSEYIIILLLAGALMHLFYNRIHLPRQIYWLVTAAIVLTMIAELAFTYYVSVYGLSNLVGHIFKMFSFWLLFVSIVRSSLLQPYQSLQAEIEVRTRAEKALNSANRALRVLRNCNLALVSINNENQLIYEICRLIAGMGDYRLAWVGYRGDDDEQNIVPVASAGIDASFLKCSRLTWKPSYEGGFPPGRAIREARPVVIQNIEQNSECAPCREDAREHGFQSLLALPLLKAGEAFGVLTIYAVEADAFTDEEIGLLTELANDLAFGIQALRGQAEHQRVATSLVETEDKFKAIFDNVMDGILLVDVETLKLIKVNRQFRHMIGYREEEMADLDLTAFHASEVIEQYKAQFDHPVPEPVSDQPILVSAVPFIRKDGSQFYADISSSPLFTLQGRLTVVGVIRDITHRKAVEDAVRASEDRLRTIVDAEPECVKMLDAQGQVLEMNPAGLAMLDIDDLGQIIGKPILRYVAEQDREAFSALSEWVFQGNSGQLEFDIVSEKGRHRTLETSAVPLFDNDKVTALLGVTRDITQQKQAESVLLDSTRQHQAMLMQTIQAVALTVEKRDPYTAGHQRRVAELAVAIGKRMGLDEGRIMGLHLGGVIHDLGKIYIPSEILNRPGRLSEAEYSLVKSHPEVGAEIIADIEFPWPVREIVLQHHERLDGKGYPHGLKGDEIVLEARIVAVADVVEAISSHRPYRPALGMAEALEEIRAGQGTKYDAAVVDACIAVLEAADFGFEL